jgi:pseudouridine synthase
MKIRLQKYISDCTGLSRRKAEEEIERGHVLMNGIVASLGNSVDITQDLVLFHGKKLIPQQEEKITIMLHKPKGVMTTRSDPQKRKTVFDLIPKQYQHLFPVGRLDYDTEGLLLLTNDGDLAYRLTHPKFEVEKEYLTVPHATVGSWMLGKWQLPEIFQQAVALHHEPRLERVNSSLLVLSRSLYLGNQMAKLLNLGEGGNYRLGPLSRDLLNDLNLSREEVAAQVRALPQAFFDFVEELKLEGARNSRLDALIERLQDREVVLLTGDHDLGPGALFFQAFAARTRVLALEDWPEAQMENHALLFWEGDDPGEAIARWQQTAFLHPPRTLILFCPRTSRQPDKPLPGPRVYLLGPEWRLEDLIKALPSVKRD